MEKYRVCFCPNNLKPFTWSVSSFEEGCKTKAILCEFDLGRLDPAHLIGEGPSQRCVAAYKAYRRSYGINHPDLIFISTCTVDRLIDEQWYVAEDEYNDQVEELDPYQESF